MRLGSKIAIAFVVGLLIIGFVGVRSYLAIEQLTEANGWVTHTHEVNESLEHVLSVLTEAESGTRGFVLTGEDSYLKTYAAAAAEINKDIASVTFLTRDNPAQQKSLEQLEKLTREKLDVLQEGIKRRKEAGLEATLPVQHSGRGQQIMEDIRALVSQMQGRERDLLATRTRAADELARNSTTSVGIGVLLSLLVLGIAAIIVTRSMRLADHRALPDGSGRNWPKTAVRYAFATAVVVLATLLRGWLDRAFGPMPTFITFYPAVLLVSTIAGGGPGIAATLLAVLAADYWFIPPTGSFGIGTAHDAVSLGIYGGTGIFLSILMERLRRAQTAEAASVAQERELALQDLGSLMGLDLDHHIVRWSQGCRRLYGYDAEEAKDRLTYELLQTHFAEPLEKIHSELLGQGHWEGEVTRRSKDGTPLSLALLWALRRDEEGKPLAILEVSTDITRQKAAEDALRQQTEELAGQNEELARQDEEISRQSEELSDQNEELQTQAEEIHGLNAELGHREKMLQTLLDSTRLQIGEQEVLEKICQAAVGMVGPGVVAAVVCERVDDELHILGHAGLDGADVPQSWSVKGSFIEMMIGQNRTASLEDASLRPDLKLLSIPGHPRFAAVLSSPLRVKGRPVGGFSIYSDTTQQWTAEQFRLIEWLAAQCSNTLTAMRLRAENLQSQKQTEFLAGILESSSQAFGVGYPDGRLGLVNKAFEELTGYGREELQSIDWARMLTPPEWMEIERRKLEELHRTGRPVRYEKEYIRKDGARVPIELLVHMVKNGEGKPQYYYSFITDITERRKADEALRENEAKYRNLFENLTEEVHFWKLVRDENGRIKTWKLVDANPPTLKTWGRKTVDEIRGKTTDEIFGPGAAEHYLPIVNKVMTEGVPYVYEDFFPNLDKHFRFTTVPLGDHFITTGADITGIKKAQIETGVSSEFLKIINESPNTRDLVQAAVTFFHKQSDCEAVGIRLRDGDDYPYYEARGFPEEFVKLENSLCQRDMDGEVQRDNVGNPIMACMCGNVIRGRFDPSKPFFSPQGSFWTNCTTDLLAGTTEADRQARTRNRCNGEGYESVALIPLRIGEDRLGLIQLNDKRKGRFNAQTIALWERLGNYLAVALARSRAEEALRQSEERYRTLFDTMTEGFSINEIICDSAGMPCDLRYLSVNPAFERHTGMKAADIVGRTCLELFPQAEPVWFERYGKVALTGEPAHFEAPFGPLGRWFEVSSYQTEPGRFAVVFFDITERKQAEESVQRSEALLRAITDNSPDPIFLKDRDCRILLANPATLAAIGKPAEQVVGRTDEEFYDDPAIGQAINANDRRIMDSGRTEIVEDLVPRPTGPATYLSTKTPWRDAQGRVIGLVGIAHDITAKKKAEEALRLSRERLDLALVSSKMATFDWDIVTNKRTWSDGVHSLLGTNPKNFTGAPDEFFRVMPPEDRSAVQAALAKAIETTVYETEYRAIWPDGSIHHIAARGKVHRDDAGQPVSMTGVCWDVTERNLAEKELRELNLSLEQRVSERTAEVQRQAHQLRALAVELSQAEQRERKRLSAILHDHIQQLLVAAQLQLGLVERADPQTVRATVQGIHSTLAEAITASRSLSVELSPPILHQSGLTAALTWLAARKEEKYLFKVHVRANSDAEPADPDVRALLFNSVQELLLNAVKHSGVREAQLIMRRTKDDWTQIIIEDKGKGFDPSTISAQRGGGFGLFSIQQRLAHLGGRMEMESAPGRGARFVLMIPIGQTAAKESAAAAEGAPTAEMPPIRAKGRRISVLLVDDHRIMRQGLSSLLQFEEDIEVVAEAENGREAVDLARRYVPDVVIMDVNMPVMDGIEATRILSKELPQVKVIGLSMHAERDTAEAMRQAGAAAYLTKGGPSEDLIAAIRTFGR